MAVPPKRVVLHHNNQHATQLGTMLNSFTQQNKAIIQFVAYSLLAAVNGNAVTVPGPTNQSDGHQEPTIGQQSRYQTCDPTVQFKFRNCNVA